MSRGDPSKNTEPCPYHLDSLDLQNARQRQHYLAQAAAELKVKEETLKADLGRVLLTLEQLQDAHIQKTLAVKNGAGGAAAGGGAANPTAEDIRATKLAALSEGERAEALAYLQAPDLLLRIIADFEACGLVGEASNKLVGYLAAVSRKLDRPLAVVIQSSSAAGKSSLMDAVLAFIPEEERSKYSAMTGQSLYYLGNGDLQHKILAIVEEEGASRASYALKLLQSEGELTIASTNKDPVSGQHVTDTYHVKGPVMIFLTTTAIEVDEELMNRCLVLTVDEGRGQTEAIHKLQRAKRTLAGLFEKQARTHLIALHQNAQRLLRPLHVVNPYADQLTFLSDKTRTRRDHEKYLTLIDTIALLHQHQREIKTTVYQGKALEYIEVSLADIEWANRLAHEVLGRSLDELPPQTRRLLGEVVQHVRGLMVEGGVTQNQVMFSRKSLRDASGWGDTQLKIHLQRLVDLEYLLSHRAQRGQGTAFELIYDGDGGAAHHLSGLIDLKQWGYDGERSGQNVGWSGQTERQAAPGRGLVGPWSGGSRGGENGGEALSTGVSGESPPKTAKMQLLQEKNKTERPSARPVVPLEKPAAAPINGTASAGWGGGDGSGVPPPAAGVRGILGPLG